MLTYATLGVAYYSKKLNMPPDPVLIMKAPIVYLHIRFNLLFSLSLVCMCVSAFTCFANAIGLLDVVGRGAGSF